MAKGVSISVRGLKETIKMFERMAPEVIKATDIELSAIAEEFANDAATAAPVDLGLLKNSITHETAGVMNHRIVSAATYSAYVEFGTITRVKVPVGYEQFAAQFKGKGLRKTGGLSPQPFFLPRVPEAAAKIEKRVPGAIAKVLK